MKFSGEHRLRASREEVWLALQDPQVLADALPGVRRLEMTGPDQYALTVTAGVGSVKGTYEGTFGFEDKREQEGCTVRARARGGAGSVEATASMTMRDGEPDGTSILYDADAKVTGPLAGVGQRMIAAAVKRMTGEFLDGLDARIVAPSSNGSAAPTSSGTSSEPVAGGTATEERAATPARTFRPARDDGDVRGGRAERDFLVGVAIGSACVVVGVAVGRWAGPGPRARRGRGRVRRGTFNGV